MASQGTFFFVVGVFVSVISFHICCVWLIWNHFQIIDFNIYMVLFFVIQKTQNPKSYGLLKLKNWCVTPTIIGLMNFNLVQ